MSGPTAVGKTAYAIGLAQKYNTAIISADSRQCFRELNIGVAKPTEEQLHKVRHYFINSHSIHDEVNAKVFEEYALDAVKEIFSKNDIAIMVGGTGLYIKAFMQGFDEFPPVDKEVVNMVNEGYRINGLLWLQNEVKKNDPLFDQKGEMQNPQRMLRALSVKLSTGSSVMELRSGKKIKRDFKIKNILLELPREKLYSNINHRVDQMMEQGMLQEAEDLFKYRSLNALQTVGYKELFDFLEGKKMDDGSLISLEKAVEEIKKNTRHYAKRQITWFKKMIDDKNILT